MLQIPKVVRDRLRAPASVVNHPDADVLTAFSERLLPELERDVVLEHLARCSDCREIVALALPEVEPLQIVATPARGWFSWPTMRWAFATAGIVVVASFGILQYRRQSAPATVAYRAAEPTGIPSAGLSRDQKSEGATEPRADEGKPSAVPAVPPSLKDNNLKDDNAAVDTGKGPRQRPATASAPNAVVAPAIGGTIAGSIARETSLAHGPRVLNQQQQLSANANANLYLQDQSAASGAAAMKQAPGYGPVPVMSQAQPVQNQAQSEVAMNGKPTTELQPLENVPMAQPAPNTGSGELRDSVERAKPAVGVYYSTAKKTSGSGQPATPAATISPRWTINAIGTLQRSFDQGNTWQDVDVAGNSVGASGGTFALAARKSKEVDKVYKREAIAPTFRAVAANGTDVWAGGSAGLLYHSTDSGTTWIRVIPASSGVALTGDVTALDFSDSIHGKVTTSTPEVWITTDAGLTWQKQ